MVKLVDTEPSFVLCDNLQSFFDQKETDCILYSEEWAEFRIHKEVLCQTKFMRNILSYSKDVCYAEIQIFCPCSKSDLESMVTFLYTGKIAYGCEVNLIKILSNLSEIFGFSKEQFLSENNKETQNDFDITKICFEEIPGEDLTYGPKSNFGNYETSIKFNLIPKSQFEEEVKIHDIESNFGKYETSSKIKEFEKSNKFFESDKIQTYESNEKEETSMNSDSEFGEEFQTHGFEGNFGKHKNNLEFKEYDVSNTFFEEIDIATNKFDTNDMFVRKECENGQNSDFEKSDTFFKEPTKDQDSCLKKSKLDNESIIPNRRISTRNKNPSKYVPKSSICDEDKPFKCEKCKRSFKFHQQLDSHNKFIHRRTFRCNFCITSFRTNSNLNRHIASVHLDSFF